MADFKKLRDELRTGREEIEKTRLDLQSSNYRLRMLAQELEALERRKDDRDETYLQRREDLEDKIRSEKEANERLLENNITIRDRLSEKERQFDLFLDPRVELKEHFSNETPFLLFPLRMETRFKTVRSKPQLWVRVFPDECIVDSFEPLLSKKEVDNAARFWAEYYSAGTSSDPANPDEEVLKLQKAAWALLVSAAGDGRAAWITRQLKPDDNRSVFPLRGDKIIILSIATDDWDPALQVIIFDLLTKLWFAHRNDQLVNQIKSDFNALNPSLNADDIFNKYRPVNFDEKLPLKIKKREEANLKIAVAVFNDLASKSSKEHSWSQPSQVNLMPERLALIRYKNNQAMEPIFGNTIPTPLPTSPDPSPDAADQFKQTPHGDLEFAEPIKWVADFNRAVEIGMGFIVDLAPDEVNGFQRLVVLGTRIGSDATLGKKQLEELFDHHYFSKKGLTLLPQGTPTNNTGSSDSGYTGKEDPDLTFDQYFKLKDGFIEVNDITEKSDGQWLAEWLGIDYNTLKKVLHSDKFDQADARNMNTALWPATMGYVLESLMEGGFSGDVLLRTREFFNSCVSGRGPIPALRIGNQPYGILATAPFRRLEWMKNIEPGPILFNLNNQNLAYLNNLYQLLLKIEIYWQNHILDKVPYVAKPTTNPYQQLLDILSLHPNSVEFHRRYLESLIEIKNKVGIIKAGYQVNSSIVSDAVSLLDSFDYQTDILPQVAALLGMPWEIPIQHLIDDQPLSEVKDIRDYTADNKNYIEALIDQMSKSENAVRTGEGLKERPAAELYRLLKYAIELGYHKSAVDAAEEKNVFSPQKIATMRTEQAFAHQSWKGEVTESRYSLLYETVPAISENKTVSEFIRDSLFDIEIPFYSKYLASQLKALENLKDASTARLERAFVEHVDCCSYRLDAWKTAILTHELSTMRNNHPGGHFERRRTGIFLGAFGWLENVKPEKNKILTPKEIPAELESDFNPEGQKVFVTDAANEGYIHAPSLNQGVTAAVLRNGYISHGKPDANNVLAVNLSSERIRLALSVIEGIQNGQSLPALLGYYFERKLHDREDLVLKGVDRYIYALRRLFPINANQLKDTQVENTGDPSVDPDSVPIEALEARNVIHGVNLVNHVKNQTTISNQNYPFGLNLINDDTTIALAITETVKALIDIADSLADLGMAESVHHVVMGNYDRAAGVLESYSKGNYPQEPDVIRTPRSGPTLTHRVSIPFPYVPLDPGASPRAQSEPSVNHWLGSILPPLMNIVCQCTYISRTDGLAKDVEISMQDIGLEPIDLLYTLNALDTQSLNELDDRFTAHLHTTTDPTIEGKIVFHYIKDPIDPGKLSVFQVMPLIKSLRSLIVEATPLSPGDIALPNEVDKKELPPPELPSKRTQDLVDRLKSDLVTAKSAGGILKAFIDLPPFATASAVQLESIRQIAETLMNRLANFLLVLGKYGIPQTSIGSIYSQQQQWYIALEKKVQAMVNRWKEKLIAYNELIANPSPTDEELMSMERLISSTTTPGVTLAVVQGKKNLFDAELLKLEGILTTSFTTVFGLVQAIRSVNTAPFDTELLDMNSELRQIPLFIYDLQARAKSLTDDLEKNRIPAVDSILTELSVSSLVDQAKKIEGAARIILGDHFKMFPRYAIPQTLKVEVRNSWNATDSLLGHLKTTEGRFDPSEDWLHGMARVHEKMKYLENCILLREAYGLPGDDFTIHPVQLPYKTEKYHWMAMAFPKDDVELEKENTLLYTAFTTASAVAPDEVCGALVDEWTEVIPATEETTGITFHYDRPNCEAPQTLLLVTPSKLTGNWDWNDLLDALEYTLEAAKLRAVSPLQIDDTPFTTFLPAVIAAESMYPYSIVLDNIAHYSTVIE